MAKHSGALGRTACAWALAAGLCAAQTITYRPGQEFRSLNTDLYELGVQKNGRVDLALATREFVFANAFPMVWFAGEDAPGMLAVDGRWSERTAVDDRLGQGQGMRLAKKDCEWHIRAYPGKPYLAVQVAYVNTTKKPVKIRSLLPWCVGESKKGALHLGEGTRDSAILMEEALGAPLEPAGLSGHGHALIHNPVSGRSLVAGFITHGRALNRIVIGGEADEPDRFTLFRAICEFEPPIEVAPGESLESEVLYLSVAEPNPLEGLERYARAVAVANGIHARTPEPTLVVAPTDAASVMREIEALSASLARYGWTHLVIGDGWQAKDNPWEPDPARFPEGFAALTGAAHAQGIAIELTARFFPAAGASGGVESAAVLRERGNLVAKTWSFDGVVDMDTAPAPLASANSTGASTRIEHLHAAVAALREGLAGARLTVTAPAWLRLDADARIDHPGHRTSVGATAMLSPHLWASQFRERAAWPNLGEWNEGAMARLEVQSVSAAGPIIAGSLADFPEPLRMALAPVSPALARPATPMDALVSASPALWVARLPLGQAHTFLVVLDNSESDGPGKFDLGLPVLGLDPNAFHTVYDVWAERYLGAADSRLQVEALPRQARFLLLGPREDRPVLLAVNRHFAMDLAGARSVSWDGARGELGGIVDSAAATDYVLRAFVPAPYRAEFAQASTGDALLGVEESVVTIRFRSKEAGPISWSIRFARTATE